MTQVIRIKREDVKRRRQDRKEAMDDAMYVKLTRKRYEPDTARIMKSNRGVNYSY